MKKTVTKAMHTDREMPWEEAHRQIAREAAREGIVLLENDGVLPARVGKLALFGAGARYTVKGGTGSGEVNERRSVSIEEGLEEAGFTITTKSWLDQYDNRYRQAQEAYGQRVREQFVKLRISELMNLMKDPFCAPVGQEITQEDLRKADTDLCIYVVARQAGEGGDRKPDSGDYCLTEQERNQILLCAGFFKRMILVLNVGGVFHAEPIPGVNALVFFAQQGGMGGAALADLICGKVTPSGRLSSTWPVRYEDVPFAMEYGALNGNLQEEYYREDIYVGYRYFDTFGVKPRYPFGYGLSYTTFRQELQCWEVRGWEVILTVRVTNEGNFPGKEVVQVYAACPQTLALPKERKRLVAFSKSGVLAPGASEEVKLQFDISDLASYREQDHVTVLEQGDYEILLGRHVMDADSVAVIRLDREQILSRHMPMCMPVNTFDRLKAPVLENISAEGLPVLTLGELETVTYTYEDLPEASCDLSVDEQIHLTVGGGLFGKRTFDAPGAAGVSTDRLVKKGISQQALADGPAGVRLQKYSVQLRDGSIKPVEQAMEAMRYLPPFIQRFTTAKPEKGQMLYQFTTAFPVELALAQTWNKELVRQVGAAIAEEMESYGVRYWLAPALNIHRNPLCGRNYEYYSEDPLLSGHFAAAATEGIQSRGGCYATLKHFACNNQEENRNCTNANVSPRALREIYLRGFEIAVRAAKPGAVMSSYNKLNGTYTPNSRDLLTGILRQEWGFEGFVMTDWFSTGPGLGSDAACIAAGNDLVMPGFFFNRWAIRLGLLTGVCSKKDLARSAARVQKAMK